MSEGKLMLEPGTLWAKVKARTEYALKCGALLSIPTKSEFVEQNGMRFLVRILSNLVRKDKAKQKQDKLTINSGNSGKEFNPFLPYEEDLFVADISDTHLCLLNKFNVVDYHLLIITREFEEQESLLTEADFAAMWACLAQFDGLAFYNGGKLAGASQRHKHLQIVPLPFAANETQIPIEPLLKSASFQGTMGAIADFPFVNALTRFDSSWLKSPLEVGKLTLERYYALLHAVGLQSSDGRQGGAYNLLATREWMLIVPRSQESFESISINSLGFAGALLVRNQQQMQILKDYGAMNVLRDVAVSHGK
jgi:sulfate adenylyltransferase (ADP) / ATP adenylyltransferase